MPSIWPLISSVSALFPSVSNTWNLTLDDGVHRSLRRRQRRGAAARMRIEHCDRAGGHARAHGIGARGQDDRHARPKDDPALARKVRISWPACCRLRDRARRGFGRGLRRLRCSSSRSELRDGSGFGSSFVRRLHRAEIDGARSQDRDASGAELLLELGHAGNIGARPAELNQSARSRAVTSTDHHP